MSVHCHQSSADPYFLVAWHQQCITQRWLPSTIDNIDWVLLLFGVWTQCLEYIVWLSERSNSLLALLNVILKILCTCCYATHIRNVLYFCTIHHVRKKDLQCSLNNFCRFKCIFTVFGTLSSRYVLLKACKMLLLKCIFFRMRCMNISCVVFQTNTVLLTMISCEPESKCSTQCYILCPHLMEVCYTLLF